MNGQTSKHQVLTGFISVGDKLVEVITQADWEQKDETAVDYIKNKPNENTALEALAECGVVEPLADENNAVYTNENGIIYIL